MSDSPSPTLACFAALLRAASAQVRHTRGYWVALRYGTRLLEARWQSFQTGLPLVPVERKPVPAASELSCAATLHVLSCPGQGIYAERNVCARSPLNQQTRALIVPSWSTTQVALGGGVVGALLAGAAWAVTAPKKKAQWLVQPFGAKWGWGVLWGASLMRKAVWLVGLWFWAWLWPLRCFSLSAQPEALCFGRDACCHYTAVLLAGRFAFASAPGVGLMVWVILKRGGVTHASRFAEGPKAV